LKRRAFYWVFVLGVVIAIIVYVARNTYFDEVTVPMPLRNEAARNPFYAAQRFVTYLGATAEWDRIQKELPPDAVLVVSSWHWNLTAGRRARMEAWVEAGGRLVIDRRVVGGREEFESWSGITRVFPNEDDEEDESAEGFGGGVGQRSRECRILRDDAAKEFELCSSEDFSSLFTTRPVAWALEDDIGKQVLRVNVGKGSVTVINGAPFQFLQFLQKDNPSLLVAAAQLRRGDDVHFLSEEEHASLLTLAWLYGWPAVVLFLGLIALALWRNGVRFGPLTAEPELVRRSLAEQIRGTGQFTMRFGGGNALHAAAVRALHEAAARRVVTYARLSAGERVEAVARLTGIEAGTLGPAIHHSGPRRAHELRQAIALIESARRRILIDKKVDTWKSNPAR
jgi:hypothetical protein